MKCSVCGVELQESNRFCGICGTPNPDFKENVEKLPDNNVQSVEKFPEAVENIVENVENSDKINVENIVENVENSEENISYVEEDVAEASVSVYDSISEKNDAESIYGFAEDNSALPEGEANTPDTADTAAEESSSFVTTQDNAPKTAEETNTFGTAEENVPKTSQETSNFGAGAANPCNIPPTPYGGYQPQNYGYPQEISKSDPQKEKRVCSMSVVVFCAVVIFILSIICGVLGGLYAGERSRRVNRTGMSYSDGAYIITAENTGD